MVYLNIQINYNYHVAHSVVPRPNTNPFLLILNEGQGQ